MVRIPGFDTSVPDFESFVPIVHGGEKWDDCFNFGDYSFKANLRYAVDLHTSD